MRQHVWAFIVAVLVCTNVFTLAYLFQPEIQNSVCVPLYSETGYECCQ